MKEGGFLILEGVLLMMNVIAAVGVGSLFVTNVFQVSPGLSLDKCPQKCHNERDKGAGVRAVCVGLISKVR